MIAYYVQKDGTAMWVMEMKVSVQAFGVMDPGCNFFSFYAVDWKR